MADIRRADPSGLEVIGVGFGRTGTYSLRSALETLGFGPCYHMWEVIYSRERARLWRRVSQGDHPGWGKVFDGYRASVDWPGAAYWRELAEEFPNAKVILTVRDPGDWYDSARNTLFKFPLRRHNLVHRAVYALFTRINPAAMDVPVMLDTVLWERVFDNRSFDGATGDREFAVERFQRHVDEVKAHIAADRLLVYRVSEGWEPLCEHLGLPVPDVPFPKSNEAQAFNDMLRERNRAAARPVLVAGGALAAALMAGVALRAARRRSLTVG
jgi:sulfotransferase family protein